MIRRDEAERVRPRKVRSSCRRAKQVRGKFLNCAADELALCDSSTTAMNIFLWGYNFKPGDEILAGSLENPAALVPLIVLSKRRGSEAQAPKLGKV
jgi:selenocysteine lyase/cysteine desulfurase